MIIPSKNLKKLIGLYPTQRLFAEKVSSDEATISKIVNENKDVPKPLIESIMLYTGWPFEKLFDVNEPSRRRDD